MNLKGTSILLLFLIQAFPGISQFKNIKLHEVDGTSPSALSIAVNPRSPANVVAVCGSGDAFVTTDGGTNWKKNKIISPMGVLGHPFLITDDKGTFFYLHLSDATAGTDEEGGSGERVVIQRSGDGGETWSPGEGVGADRSRAQFAQRATIDSRGNLYVTWTGKEGDGNACKTSIFFSMSRNGKKWTDAVSISENAGTCADFRSGAIPAVTDGKVMITWAGDDKIYLDRSFNGGEWWLSNDIVVAENKAGFKHTIPGHGERGAVPVLTTDNSKSPYRGSLYIVWADQRNGDADIWFTRSHNFGDNWSQATRIDKGGEGKHQYMPWITVDQETGYIYVLYYDRSNYDDDRTDVYLAWSRDGGVNFENVRVSESPFVPREGFSVDAYNGISARKGIITPIWSRVDDGKVSVWTATIRQEDLEKKR